MKKILLSISICATMMMAASCGKSASYTDNPILGTIPSISEQFYTAEQQAKDKMEVELNELANSGKFEKAMKLDAQYEAKRKEKKAEFEAEYAAELAKIVGRDVPITYSAALNGSSELFYTVSDAKIIDNKGTAAIALTINAKRDLTVGRMGGLDHRVCFRLITTDGKVLTSSLFLPIAHQLDVQTFKVDQLISGPEMSNLRLSMRNNAADYVNFAGVEFIDHAEYKAAQ